MTFLPVPASVTSADELLPVARRVIDADVDRIDAESPISCRAGCSACCHQAVPVHPAEVRAIHDHLDEMPDERRRVVRDRIDAAASRLVAAGLTAHSLDGTDPERRSEVAHHYFSLSVPCPLLDPDGTCGVRPVRPLACREYVVTSDPVHCGELGRGQIVRIRPRRNVLAGFRQVSTELGEPERLLLALALAEPRRPPPEAEPRRGPAAARVMTSTYQ